ncbi:MAG TPA: hypothetical protein VLA61_26350 [Ideonella sp.]|nr:hypothetical protein [Ideonella sp.]HSI51805.1 hypothetical protein [Ideonella sp.]
MMNTHARFAQPTAPAPAPGTPPPREEPERGDEDDIPQDDPAPSQR